MSKLTRDTWVLVADGDKALFLKNVTDEENPNLVVVREETQDNPPSREQGANRPGRFNDGPNVSRSAVDDTDWHALAKERFADHLAEMLYERAHRGAFDRIVLVAPPRVLGDLRAALHKEVDQKVVGEVGKDLTNHPVDRIEAAVTGALAG
jgi:protein required for attachment to host cells